MRDGIAATPLYSALSVYKLSNMEGRPVEGVEEEEVRSTTRASFNFFHPIEGQPRKGLAVLLAR